jgi:CBS domain containing-hemolysin-like protein
VNDALALVLAVVLLAANAFFVGAEFALISTRREQLEPHVAAGTRGARTALKAVEQVSLMMAGAQLGITICSLGLGAVAEPAVAHLVEQPLQAAGVPEVLVHPIAFAIAMTIVVGLHMVLGEMVPKNIALAGPARSALLLGPPLFTVVRVLRPVIAALNHLSNAVLRLIRVEPKDEVTSAYTADQVHDLVAESHDEGLLDEEGRQLLSGALEFEQQTAARVTLPAVELVTVTPDVTAGELRQLCVRTGFSRFPVVEGREMLGYVHVKDLTSTDRHPTDSPLPPSLVRPLATVHAGSPLHEVLATMQADGSHMGLVVRDDGSTAGVVALEDVLEELVGEVRDGTRNADTQSQDHTGQGSKRMPSSP